MKLQHVFFAGILFSFLICSGLFAQQNDSSWVKEIFIGPMIGINGAMSTTDYKVSNTKRDVGIGYDIGAVASYRFEQSSAVTLGLHYYNLAFQDNNENVSVNGAQKSLSKKLTTSGNFSYISFSAMLRAYVLLIGFRIGIPVGGTAKNVLGDATGLTNEATVKEESVTVSSSDMNFLFEPKIGFEIPVAQRDTWQVNIGILFGYPVQTISSSPFTLPKMVDNYKLPNTQFSVSYTFAPWRSPAKN